VAEVISTNLADGRVVLDNNVPWTLWASSSGSGGALCVAQRRLLAASQLRRPIHRKTGPHLPRPRGHVGSCASAASAGVSTHSTLLLPSLASAADDWEQLFKTLQVCSLIDLERHLFLPDLGIEF
jgi:hypothetical protein